MSATSTVTVRGSTLPTVTAMHPADRHYRNQTVRLADLTVITDVVEDVTFENCTIEGPAVVALLDTNLANSRLEGDPDAVFWVIPPERETVMGAIALVRCTVVGCSLRRIGLAIPEGELDLYRRGFGI